MLRTSSGVFIKLSINSCTDGQETNSALQLGNLARYRAALSVARMEHSKRRLRVDCARLLLLDDIVILGLDRGDDWLCDWLRVLLLRQYGGADISAMVLASRGV